MSGIAGRKRRVLFDTNVYDAIAAAGDAERIAAMIDAGMLSVIVTPVQEDEIGQIRNAARRRRLLALFRRIGGERVDPAAVIAGDITYLSRDEILARVAEACCDLLVTEDRALLQRCGKAVRYAEFSERISG